MRPYQLLIILAILLMALLLSACGPAANSQAASQAQIPQIMIKAADFSFDAPAQIEAGLVSITLENDGQESHHAQLVRLNDGVTLEQFQSALHEGPEAFSMVTWAGGPGTVAPGRRQQVTVKLSAGQYVLLCFIPSQDNVAHLDKGMVRPIEVVAPKTQASISEPKADAMVKLLDFSFVLPPEVKAGRQVWKIVNEGQQAHEIDLIKLAEGKAMADVNAFMQSPHAAPPFEDAGGFVAIEPGEAGWLHLDLEPGEYVALCFVPDEEGKSHTEHGMVLSFSVK
jgi:hypothetical protein